MKYKRRDLRAIDVFALILIGIGGVFFALGALRYIANPKIEAVVSYKQQGGKLENAGKFGTDGKKLRPGEPVQTPNWPAIRTGLFGTVFILPGTTMNVGLRRVMRNGDADDGRQSGPA